MSASANSARHLETCGPFRLRKSYTPWHLSMAHADIAASYEAETGALTLWSIHHPTISSLRRLRPHIMKQPNSPM